MLKGYQHYGSIRRLYILHSPDDEEFKFHELAEDVRERLKAVGFNDVVLTQIDPFDMHSIIDTILSIVDKEKSPIYINMTGGTNLMAGAACAASFFVGAKAYYVLGKKGQDLAHSRVLELPVPNIPYTRVLQKTQLSILKRISDLGGITSNSALRTASGMSAQELSYHIRELEKKALVVATRGFTYTVRKRGKTVSSIDRRKLRIEITNAGKLLLSWSKSLVNP